MPSGDGAAGPVCAEIFEKIVSAGAVRDVFGQQVIRSDGQDFRGAEDSGFRQFFQSFGFAYIAFGGRAAFEKVFRARFRTDLSGAGDGARYRVADRCFENGFQVRIHRRNRFLGILPGIVAINILVSKLKSKDVLRWTEFFITLSA